MSTASSVVPKVPSRRRWLQFSLTSLLIVVALVAAISAWIARPLWVAREQRAIADEIVSLGAGVRLEPTAPGWLCRVFGDESLGVVVAVGPNAPGGRLVGFGAATGPNVDDRTLQRCEGLPHLRQLNLSYANVTDVGLSHLRTLNNLEVLDLRGTRITDAGLQQLAALEKLRWLDLGATAVTDAGLVQLKGLHSLQQLYLDGTKVTNAGVETLRQYLPNCKIDLVP